MGIVFAFGFLSIFFTVAAVVVSYIIIATFIGLAIVAVEKKPLTSKSVLALGKERLARPEMTLKPFDGTR